jgi:hypothetical protein
MIHLNNPLWRELGLTTQGIYRTRFLSYVEKVDGELGCWIWRYGAGTDRYGRFWMNNRAFKANRAAFELWFRPLRDDEHALHVCDVPRCVNPWHMYAGTHIENMKDRQERGRSRGRNSKTLTTPPTPWREEDFWRFFSEDDLNTVIRLLMLVVESGNTNN